MHPAALPLAALACCLTACGGTEATASLDAGLAAPDAVTTPPGPPVFCAFCHGRQDSGAPIDGDTVIECPAGQICGMFGTVKGNECCMPDAGCVVTANGC